jgi:hypothetical protein
LASVRGLTYRAWAVMIHELERAVQALGRETLGREPDWSAERLDEFYAGGLEAFGPAPPDDDELLEARLWFLLDCPLPDGQTPLWRERQSVAGRAVELLARSELRAWRVTSLDGVGLLTALCPLGSGRARLEFERSPAGVVRPGSLIVARSVPVGPARWALLGRIPVVDPSVAADFDRLLGSLGAPRGEFWHVHGGVLSHAAWAWPEVRSCTASGELVEASEVRWPVLDIVGVLAALHADEELARDDARLASEGTTVWRWRWTAPSPGRALPASPGGTVWASPARVLPASPGRGSPGRALRASLGRVLPASPGVRAELCDEDACPAPYLATVTLNPRRRELSCAAPTSDRLGLAAGLLGERLGAMIGSAGPVVVEPARSLPRWARERAPTPVASRPRLSVVRAA